MAKGFLPGAVFGLIVSGAGAAVLSLATGLPQAPRPDVAEVEVPAGSAFGDARDDRATPRPASEQVAPAGAAPQIAAPQPDDLSPLADADTTPAEAPSPDMGEASMTAPEAGSQSGAVSVGTEAPAPEGLAGARAPVAPDAEAELSISTEPAQPPAPPLEEAESGLEPAPEAVTEAVDAAPVPQAPAPEVAMIDAPAQPAPPTDEETAPDPAAGDSAASAPQTRQPGAPGTVAEAGDPAPAAGTAPAAPAILPRVGDAAATGDTAALDRPMIGEPAGTLAGQAGALTSSRLPTVGDPDPESDAASMPENAVALADLPPLERYAAPYSPSGDKPLMSVVLIDDGTGPLGPDAIEGFPFPLSFALDASSPGAAQRMKRYRDMGFEVLALVDLPENATPRDAEVSLSAYLSNLPEAVAVMEGDATGLQGSRALSDQVTQIVQDTGHGLVMLPKGLNTAQALAAKAGVPSATVFRDFDREGQGPTVIRRFLDQAAFKARQDSAVIMLGRLRPDTLSALLLWGLQDRAASVDLVPISAVLLQDAG